MTPGAPNAGPRRRVVVLATGGTIACEGSTPTQVVGYSRPALSRPWRHIDVAGGTGDIAFRIAESLGIVNRSEIAEEVRSLDQDARAALRGLGGAALR